MPDYKKMYFRLSGKVADAIELLTEAQIEAEETAIKEAHNLAVLLDADGKERDE